MLLELPLSSVNVPFLRSTSVTKPTCEPVAPVGTPLSATATSPTCGIASGVPYPRQFEAAYRCEEVLHQATNHIFLLLHVRRRVDLTREHQHAVARRPPPSARRWPNLGRSSLAALHAADNTVDQRKPGKLICMLPIWLVTTLPTWLVIFIVLYALAALYVAIKFREVRKFLAGAFFVSSGILGSFPSRRPTSAASVPSSISFYFCSA